MDRGGERERGKNKEFQCNENVDNKMDIVRREDGMDCMESIEKKRKFLNWNLIRKIASDHFGNETLSSSDTEDIPERERVREFVEEEEPTRGQQNYQSSWRQR